jgi:crotonobetainyl-CoA:carnitine CoA-transferase CaiB-like acyl-CoA transferase
VPIADLGGGGSMAVIAILSGLWARQSTQVAQWIDVSMLDGAVSWLPVLMAENLGPHGLGQQTALFSGGYACYTTYPTQDGRFMCVGAIEPKFWQTFCETLNVSHFVGQQLAPMGRQAEMKAMLNAKFLQHPQKYWIDQFADIEACCTPVLSLGEVMNDQQLQERSMIDRRADMPYIGRPIQWMGVEPEPIDTKTAALGEDTAATLADIGVSVDQLEALKDGGVV